MFHAWLLVLGIDASNILTVCCVRADHTDSALGKAHV